MLRLPFAAALLLAAATLPCHGQAAKRVLTAEDFDANNLEIADLMLEWVGDRVPRAPRR
jgi:hypothetical protein